MNSDCCNKPTLTFPNGTYNATQVRLYGIVQENFISTTGKSTIFTGHDTRVKTELSLSDESENAKNIASRVDELRNSEGSEEDILDALYKENLLGSGPTLPIIYSTYIIVDLKKPGSSIRIVANYSDARAPISCGIIVGYAYEGFCYDLPKPKIMVIPAIPQKIPKGDSIYYEKNSSESKYMLWIVDKLDECVEFDMNQGFIEQIVLEANLPGKRSPSMYASKMMMGHRGGKLGEP